MQEYNVGNVEAQEAHFVASNETAIMIRFYSKHLYVLIIFSFYNLFYIHLWKALKNTI